nr:Zinc knuckle family protein [Ipomoea batatas]
MVKQLRYCDRKVQFWVLVKGRKNPRKIELRPIINDADIVSLVGEVPPNKEPDIYVEHLFDDQWDYDVEISRELGDDCLLLEGDEVHEVDCELSEELFRSLEHSKESDGEVTGLDNVFQQTNLNKEGFKFEIGMIFKSTDEFKLAVKCHETTRRKDIQLKKNERRRVRHTCGDQDENRTVNFGFLAKLYKDDFKLYIEWGRIQFQDHVKAKLKCQAVELEEVVAGMEEVVAEEVQVEWQFEDIAVEAQVPSFVLDEMVSTLAL